LAVIARLGVIDVVVGLLEVVAAGLAARIVLFLGHAALGAARAAVERPVNLAHRCVDSSQVGEAKPTRRGSIRRGQKAARCYGDNADVEGCSTSEKGSR